MSRRLSVQSVLAAGLFASVIGAQSRPATSPAVFDPAGQLTYDPMQLAEYDRFLVPMRSGGASELPSVEGAPAERATTYLVWANRLLAIPTGRAATRWLIGIDGEEDRELLSQCGRAATEYIRRAKTSLRSARGLPREEKRKLQDTAFTLTAFADLFCAADAPADNESLASTYRRAGRTLAVVGEDVDPLVAACAQMWQAFAWELAGRRERAMASLPGALQKPSQLPYDFLSRLLRCRIVIDAGGPVAATAMTVRIRSMCGSWFSSDDTGRSASRLAALLQIRATRAWLNELGDRDPEARARLEGVLADVQTELFPSDVESAVLFLEEAIPILIAEPKPSATQPAAATTTAPADTDLRAATQTGSVTTQPAQ